MLSGRTTLQAGACAGAPPRLNIAQKPRIARQTRHRCSAAAQPVDGGASSVAAAAASCPYSAAKAALQQFLPQQQVQQQQQWQQQQWGAAGAEGFVQTPGPHPLSVESVAMVTTIFTEGLHEAILRGALRYGPVSRYANPAALGGAAGWVFLNSPQDIQYVNATNTRNFAERFLPDIYKWVTHEKGILGSSGEYNRRHRKLVGPPFRSAALLSRFADVVVNRSARVAETFASQPGSFRTNVAVQTQRLTLDIVGLTAFSHDFGECDAIARDISGSAPPSASDQDRLLWAVNAFGQVLSEVFITPMPLLRLMDALGFRQLQTLREACEVMRHSMLGVIAERRGALEARAAAGAGAGEARDVLDMLLQATDDNGVPMTDSELWEDVHDIMGAGHETTATTTAAALYCIAAHPEVEARVVQELEAVLGGRLPTMADLDSMPYLSAVVKEVLRLYPAIPVFPRQAAAEDRLPSGHRVRKGDVVFMSTYALHRDPAVWEDPLRFDPERFLGARGEALHRFQWLPFGAGPRVCLGASFATMSVSLMVATLLQRCKFTPVRPTAQLIPAAYDITLNFDRTGGLLMEVEPRRRAHGIPSGLAAEQPVHA